jgi:hypothetical protein
MNQQQPSDSDDIIDALRSWSRRPDLPLPSGLKASVRRTIVTASRPRQSSPTLAFIVGLAAFGLSMGVWRICRNTEPSPNDKSNATRSALAGMESTSPSKPSNAGSAGSLQTLIANADLLSQRIEAIQLQTQIASMEVTVRKSLAQSELRLAKDRVIARWYESDRTNDDLPQTQ